MKTMFLALAIASGTGALMAATTAPAASPKDATDNCCMKMDHMSKDKMMCDPKTPPAQESKDAATPPKPATDDHATHHH